MNLFEGYMSLDTQGRESFTTFEGGTEYQINCFLIPAFITDDSRFSREKGLYLQWDRDVLELNIYDVLYNFGISGDLTVMDNNNSVSYALEQFVSYDLVINITQKITQNSPYLKYEPYILNIINVEPISNPGGQAKMLKVYFEDMLSSTAKKTTLGTFLKMNPDFKNTKSFPEAFKIIIDYLQNIIMRNNADNHEYKKELKFDTMYQDCDEQSIIETIIDNLEQDVSMYEVIEALAHDACIPIKPESQAVGNFESIGDLLVPMFCREEYTDAQNYYYQVYGVDADDMTNVSDSSGYYLHRPFAFRNFYMPFENAFGRENGPIYESFSVATGSDDSNEVTINGICNIPIDAFEAVTANLDLTAKRWKNLAFISSGANGGSSRLVFFRWFYEYYNQIFLNGQLNDPTTKISNVLPPFFVAGLNNPDMFDDKDLQERNSNVILIRNEKSDPVKEILMQIGKSIASLVLLNNSYSFITQGNLLRRPNEIINLYMPNDGNEDSPTPIRTDFAMSKNIMLYVTAVIHSFSGTNYKNKIVCNRIYEKAE